MTQQRVMFVGEDNAAVDTLWVSDGTASGTVPLTGIANTDTALSTGLFSEFLGPFFTSLNGLVYFAGVNAKGFQGLWQTDGTAAGTKEIAGIAGADTAGLNVSWLTAFNGKLYFQALNTAGQSGLWMSDGSAAGTREITGIANTYQGNLMALGNANGLTPAGLFVFANTLLFGGLDAAGHGDLWRSDGTAAGTKVLSSSAKPGGVGAPLFLGVVNGDLLFQGAGSDGINGLWRMAPGGTPQQITGIAGANAKGVFSSSFINLGQFAIINNIMLFQGYDSANKPSLFSYDGTTGIAREITGIGNAYTGVDGFAPTNFVAYNGKILFEAPNASFTEALWQSDGTAVGTTEITPLNGQSFAVVNGVLLFTDNLSSLGRSDGTATGTHPLVIANDDFGSLYPSDLTTVTLACFAAGTRVRTPRGELAVEFLGVGEQVVTQSGRLAPVRWLGHRRIDCRAHPDAAKVWPVRILAGAFGAGLPGRDLFLSLDHAAFVAGALIPIRYLINGATIVQEERDEVTYWHVELDRHDVILAEGLPCESFLDTGNRADFDNGGRVMRMHPEFALRVWEANACAPLVLGGAALEAARRSLLDRATTLGHSTTRDPDLRVVAAGRELRPKMHGRVRRFRVPAAACGVRLVSRSAVPAEVRHDSNDHRRLGVAVSRVVYGGEEISLNDPRLGSGWHDAEYSGGDIVWRWTDGEAGLALPGGRALDIEVAIAERYWLNDGPAGGGLHQVCRSRLN